MQLQKIKILDPHEAIKIAAGEVIERPANIIKELLENSIDAGATSISIHLNAAGKDLIKITDNGCGMSDIDAKLCFSHHATSKIKSVDDLSAITTYGFRGEALSSVAAVSAVELMTKTEDQKIGTHIKIQYSKFLHQTQVAHQTGTTIIITDLFANIPARKKFLKSDDTEWNQVIVIFQAFCLRYLDISFKLFHNDTLNYHCQATTNIMIRCAQLWNGNLHDQLIVLPETIEKNISIKGVISALHYYRFNRGQIFTFVNNRWVKNQELTKGILQGYDGVLPHQKYPAAFLFVDINPELIDINIHPKKEEVKFLNPGIIQKIITKAVQQALNNFINQKIQPTQQQNISIVQIDPESTVQEPLQFIAPQFSQTTPPSNISSFSYIDHDPFAQESPINIDSTSSWLSNKQESSIKSIITQNSNLPIETTTVPIFKDHAYSIVGQFKKTYIIIEQEQELIMIDQHAAHERIIYERLIQQAECSSVQLMFPHIVKLSSALINQLHQYQHLLAQHGIITESFSDHELIIKATPVGMQGTAAEEVIRMLCDLCQQQIHTQIILSSNVLTEKIMSAKACKTACKAGDSLDMQQMQALLKELMTTNNRFSCPHGRPTMWNMSLKDIEKHFKRDYAGSKNNNNFN